ncbi:MAG: hypothetical protein KGM42_12335 [Hyphomicrobiales bacterium]|nr:hypothetical protein [Hyphomicrobiales bacterium]
MHHRAISRLEAQVPAVPCNTTRERLERTQAHLRLVRQSEAPATSASTSDDPAAPGHANVERGFIGFLAFLATLVALNGAVNAAGVAAPHRPALVASPVDAPVAMRATGR